MTIPRRFEPLSCSLIRLPASMKMSNFERKYPPGYHPMICNGKAKTTSEKALLQFYSRKRLYSFHTERLGIIANLRNDVTNLHINKKKTMIFARAARPARAVFHFE